MVFWEPCTYEFYSITSKQISKTQGLYFRGPLWMIVIKMALCRQAPLFEGLEWYLGNHAPMNFIQRPVNKYLRPKGSISEVTFGCW